MTRIVTNAVAYSHGLAHAQDAAMMYYVHPANGVTPADVSVPEASFLHRAILGLIMATWSPYLAPFRF